MLSDNISVATASFCLLTLQIYRVVALDWQSLKLLDEHATMVLRNNRELGGGGATDEDCPYKESLKTESCWGYEKDCKKPYFDEFTNCSSKEEKRKYWTQADFGKLKQHLEEMKSRQICKSENIDGSSLTCTQDATMCKAKNLYIHFPNFDKRDQNVILVPDDGVIGGYCSLNKELLKQETKIKRSLSTWGFQLQSFQPLKSNPFADKSCDIILDKPVVFVQLDSVGNLYHHFCDFFNLYLTQHANNSWFGTDVQIVRWNEHPRFRDPFMDAWKAFTDSSVLSLHDFAYKRVCIPDATFAFLPRMIHGLYYSTYLEQGCRGSGLVKSFGDHLLHRLGIKSDTDHVSDVIRVTFLARGGKSDRLVFRRVLNLEALVKRLNKLPNIEVKVVSYDFDEMNFLEQLQTTRKTDLFIGMHGAGLAHFLFLPDWAVAFELYNCGDIRCYRDLAGLRGLRYLTWEDESKVRDHDRGIHPHYGDHAKFWNFSFDVEEFIRLVRKARNMLLETDRFRHLKKNYNPRTEF
uniref:EGF domain-specific O-linked N-acetylglucosamine transferase-like n=1 Tax=Styela clava TaxID=7725 RepID=UPI00193947D8|nr:EGF domain-specific O-linked N-acetylglucosamine transferase-like [Styela clava]